MEDGSIANFLHWHERSSTIGPFIQAISRNDLKRFKELVDDENARIHIPDDMLFCYMINLDRWDMFSYAINLPQFDCNFTDHYQTTLLMHLATYPSREKYAKALIAKGTNVKLCDHRQKTYLHLAATNPRFDVKIVEAVIENGCDIDAQCLYDHETALMRACRSKNWDFVHLLLYYGADPKIPDKIGILPICVVPPDLQDILFDYTFDDETVEVEIMTLKRAICGKGDLFERMFDKIEVLSYNEEELIWFSDGFDSVVPSRIKLFLENFGDMIEEGKNSKMINSIIKSTTVEHNRFAFLESSHGIDLIQAIRLPNSVVASLVWDSRIKREYVPEIVYIMLSYGLELTSSDLDEVYEFYDGFCELFRIMLHMDVTILDCRPKYLSFARFYYDFNNCDIEGYCNPDIGRNKIRFLKYFNHPKLREQALDIPRYRKMVKKLPDVQPLVELSRNVARKHIIKHYNIKTSRQFYTILKQIPVGGMNQKILGLEVKLYSLPY